MKKSFFAAVGALVLVLTLVSCGVQSAADVQTPQPEPPKETGEYTAEFDEAIAQMKECYTLREYKGVDLDALYSQFRPSFEKADENASLYDAYAAWQDFCNAVPDGHVYAYLKDGTSEERGEMHRKYMTDALGYDFGFCPVSAENGDILIANVDETSEAYALGMRDGCRLLAVDGLGNKAAKERAIVPMNISDNFNREFYKGMFVTCKCAERATFYFVDEGGFIQEVTLEGKGAFYERFSCTKSALLHSCRDKENLSCELLQDGVGLMYFNDTMIISSNGFNNGGSYEQLKSELREKLTALKAQGADSLIIDMRGNSGGYREVAAAVASMFTSKPLLVSEYSATPEVMENVVGEQKCYATADNVWGDGKIVILVNDDTASAAELFIHTMKKLPNVTTLGLTNSCGCAMGVFSIELEHFNLSYPTVVNLDENGEIIVDGDESGDMQMPVDLRVPLNAQTLCALCDPDEDYMLEYALDYMND